MLELTLPSFVSMLSPEGRRAFAESVDVDLFRLARKGPCTLGSQPVQRIAEKTFGLVPAHAMRPDIYPPEKARRRPRDFAKSREAKALRKMVRDIQVQTGLSDEDFIELVLHKTCN